MATNEYLTQNDLADMMQCSTKTLEAWRQKGTGPTYCKWGRGVRYRVPDVEAFMAKNVFQSTSQYGAISNRLF